MAKARYSSDDDCWLVPVSNELWAEGHVAQPVRIEIRDDQLWITMLPSLSLSQIDWLTQLAEREHPGFLRNWPRETTLVALSALRAELTNREDGQE